MDKTIVPCGLVWFTILKFAVGPCQESRGWLHVSWLFVEPEEDCWGWDAIVGRAVGRTPPVDGVTSVPCVFNVGRGGGVLVGAAVIVAVGGAEVGVGAACCVSATMVKAAA